MALDILSTYLNNVSRDVRPGVVALSDDDFVKMVRTVVSTSSRTEADGSTVTITVYSDGTRETTVEEGDSIVLSPEAQNAANIL